MTRERALPGALRRTLGVTIACWAALLAANDALPYLGLRDDSCQTMFCDMAWGEHWNTHYFVPQRMLSDLWADLEITEVAVEPAPSEPRTRAVTEWLTRPGRVRNTEAVRVAVWQLCRSGHHVALTWRRADRRADAPHAETDACRVSALSEPHFGIPVRLYDADHPPDPR